MANNLYLKLRKDIITGKYGAGTQLFERDLVKKFKVSRTPIREAMKILEKEGLIINEGRRGYRLKVFSIQEISELGIILAVLEGLAAKLSVQKINSQSLSRMKEINNLLKRKKYTKDKSILTQIARNFHKILVKECGNKSLIKIIKDLGSPLVKYLSLAFFFQNPSKIVKEHDKIIEAIEKKMTNRVRELVESHILLTWKLVIDLLKKTEGIGTFKKLPKNLRKF